MTIQQARCRAVAEDPKASAIEADQARELLADCAESKNRFAAIKDRPALFGKTVGQAQAQCLKRRLANFLALTQGLWQT